MSLEGVSSPTVGLVPITSKRSREPMHHELGQSPTPVAWLPADCLPGADFEFESVGGTVAQHIQAHVVKDAPLGVPVPSADGSVTEQSTVAGAQLGMEALNTSVNSWFQSLREVAKLSLILITLVVVLWMARYHSLPLALWAVN